MVFINTGSVIHDDFVGEGIVEYDTLLEHVRLQTEQDLKY